MAAATGNSARSKPPTLRRRARISKRTSPPPHPSRKARSLPPTPRYESPKAAKSDATLTVMETGFYLVEGESSGVQRQQRAKVSSRYISLRTAFVVGGMIGLFAGTFTGPSILNSASDAYFQLSSASTATVAEVDGQVEKGEALATQAVESNPKGAVTANPSGLRSHTIGRGDTLGLIARSKLGSAARWREIATLNGIDNPSAIEVGTTLLLPKQ